MRKISVLLIGLVALFATGCAEESTDVKSDDIYVTSFYDMGCSHTFGNFNLGKNSSVTGQYPNEIMAQLNCNSDVSVRIDFYDSMYDYPGHYRYFLVNNTHTTYQDTIYTNSFGESSGVYTFTTDPSIEQYGTYYGKYTVTALNLETRKYTVQEYRITAFENSSWSKEEAAVSKFEARKAPELPAKSEEAKADNTASNNAASEEAK